MTIRERVETYGSQTCSLPELLHYVIQPHPTRQEKLAHTLNQITTQDVLVLSKFELEFQYQLNRREAAVLESIGRILRLASPSQTDRKSISSPEAAVELLSPQLAHLEQEHFVVLLLDTKNHVRDQHTISIGTMDMSVAHPRDVFRAAIRSNAAGVLLAHNHPSTIPDPSPEDLKLTQQLVQAGKLVGIEVVDHVIIGGNRWISLREKGLM